MFCVLVDDHPGHLVDTAIDQFLNDLPWSFMPKVDILSIALNGLNKAYTVCDKTL